MEEIKVRDYTCRICINENSKIYKLFVIGYHKDGGYFISDVGGKKENNYIVFKFSNKNQIHPDDKTFKINLSKPKLSHHIDGNVHISGKDILSGFDKKGIGKGIYIKSIDLRVGDKRGPLLGFYLDNKYLNLFNHIELNDKTIKKQHLIIGEKSFIPFFKYGEAFQICIEGYYIHKRDLSENIFDIGYHNGIIIYHPFFGNVSLTPIISPKESPYVIGLLFYKKPLASNSLKLSSKLPFVFGGGPGEIGRDGIYHSINIVYDNGLIDSYLNDIPSINYIK
ncbi:hypothetical protein LAT59_03775 [Candidatus Gracilibacteria bacterium]|nr:hypothetical protein [Candidatus Gracilibacteria bacterium]